MDILPYKPGQKIDTPGVYRMTLEEYHSDCCEGPSVSSSGLRRIYMESAAQYWAFSYLNPDRWPEEDKAVYRFGRAAHAIILGDEVFADRYVVVPADAPRRPSVVQLNAKKPSADTLKQIAWWEAFDKAVNGRTVITAEEHAHILTMARILEKSPDRQLLDGAPELSLVWRDAKTGVWLKSRPDNLHVDGVMTDFKKTTERTLRAVKNAIRRYGYDMQMALAGEGVRVLLGLETVTTALVFQQDRAPYLPMTIAVSDEAIYWARVKNRKAIDTFAECLASGRWPGPADDIPEFTISDAEEAALLKMQEDGLLPKLEG